MWPFYSSDYINVVFFLFFSFALSIILLTVSFFITFTSKLDIEKSSVYECGFNPFSETRYQFEVLFYLLAILFLLFDIEILYLFPLALSFVYLSSLAYYSLCLFFILLFVGLLLEISQGTLDIVKGPITQK